MKRYGQVIKIKPEYLKKYKKLHAYPWPEINAKIKECNIQNYSIYLSGKYLFSYFEYIGNNFKDDMEKMASDVKTQEWWKETDQCQEPIESAEPGTWWTDMEEVYHLE